MKQFSKYGEILLGAFSKHGRSDDILRKKKEIIDTVFADRNVDPESILFLGFTPVSLVVDTPIINVAGFSDAAIQLLKSSGKDVNVIKMDDLGNYYKAFDCVIALDEYFTYASSEDYQKAKVQLACDLSKELLVTTLRDYKNQNYKEREFSIPSAIRGDDTTAYLEYHELDFSNRAEWDTTVYELGSELKAHGPFERRSMFFKQLAKFTKDADAVDFLVHKNLMYKSLLKKNYEHVISIKFE